MTAWAGIEMKQCGIRIVALTPSGKKLIVPIFRKHAADLGRVFSELSSDELQQLETILKKVGRRAEALGSSHDPGSAEHMGS